MQKTKSQQKMIFIGFLIWIAAFVFQYTTLYQEEWARLILLLAALVWLPLALPLVSTRKMIVEQALQYGTLPAAVLLGVALFLPAGLLAAVLTLPWLTITALIAFRGVPLFWGAASKNAGITAISAAHLFLIVGGAWTMADRLGWEPLGFDPAVVLLTGIHFHYAGFMFPLLAGLAASQHSSAWLKIGCWLAVIAVPLTAAGITVSQLWQAPLLEIAAATTVAVAGWSTAIGYLDFIVKKKVVGFPRVLWSIMAFALILSMTFALLYASRYWFAMEWLAIPRMRALHGTLNAIFFTGCGLLGWNRQFR